MAKPALLEPEDLALLVGTGGASSTEDPRLLQAVRSAESDLRTALRHPLVRTTDDTVAYDGDGTNVLRLCRLHASISRIEVDGQELDPARVQVSRIGLARFADGARWPFGYANIRVTMDHGIDPVPDEIRDAVLERAGLKLSKPASVRQASVGQVSYTFERVGATEAWSTAVAEWAIGMGDRA